MVVVVVVEDDIFVILAVLDVDNVVKATLKIDLRLLVMEMNKPNSSH